MSGQKKLGFYRKSKDSNRKLIKLFEECQLMWYSSPKGWQNKKFIEKLGHTERQGRKEILKMLKKGEIRTPDDFYRAAWLFRHGNSFRSHALAVALAAVSYQLGEPWGKNFYAVALDRFLLSIKQPQYFGTLFKKKKGEWQPLPYNPKTTDKERKEYSVEPIKKAIKRSEEFERGVTK